MSNMDRYGLLGIPAAFIKYCKSQKDCSSCPVARAKAEAMKAKYGFVPPLEELDGGVGVEH